MKGRAPSASRDRTVSSLARVLELDQGYSKASWQASQLQPMHFLSRENATVFLPFQSPGSERRQGLLMDWRDGSEDKSKNACCANIRTRVQIPSSMQKDRCSCMCTWNPVLRGVEAGGLLGLQASSLAPGLLGIVSQWEKTEDDRSGHPTSSFSLRTCTWMCVHPHLCTYNIPLLSHVKTNFITKTFKIVPTFPCHY